MNTERHKKNINQETTADSAEKACGKPGAAGAEAIDYRAALAECQQELAEAKAASLRAHADFDNYRKRLRAERDQEFSRGSDRVLSDILPVLDDFSRALSSINEKSTVESMRCGVELIQRQLQGLLERYGLTPITVLGERFDPKYHDAVARVVTTESPEHTIIAEVQRGYLKNGEVFRPARVAVAVPPDEEESGHVNF